MPRWASSERSSADAGRAFGSDPLFEVGLSGTTRPVVIGGCIDQEDSVRPSDRNIPVTTHLINQLALPDRLQPGFPRWFPIWGEYCKRFCTHARIGRFNKSIRCLIELGHFARLKAGEWQCSLTEVTPIQIS